MSEECRAASCRQSATLALVLSYPVGDDGFVHTDRIPYCDNDAGWFFRAMTAYGYFVHGLEVLENPFGDPLDTNLARV